MNILLEKLLSLAEVLFHTRSTSQRRMLDEFTVFVKDQLAYLMEQVKCFQADYIQVSEKINALYAEMRTLNEELAHARLLQCRSTDCAERH